MKLIVALAAAFPLLFASAGYALATEPDATEPAAQKAPAAHKAPAAPKAPGTFATAPT